MAIIWGNVKAEAIVIISLRNNNPSDTTGKLFGELAPKC
jgi:hypothetical protein